jgi:hypothetical protein
MLEKSWMIRCGLNTRSDFGEMIQGKFATTQLDFAELAGLLLACIGEDESLTFTRHSAGNYLAGHKQGDWTYEIDNANQITMRYWINEFRSIDEQMSHPRCITTPQERAELQNLLLTHVRTFKANMGVL